MSTEPQSDAKPARRSGVSAAAIAAAEAADTLRVTYIGETSGVWGPGSGSGDVSGFDGLKGVVELPPQSRPPYGSWFDEAIAEINSEVGAAVSRVFVHRGELTLFTSTTRLSELMRLLRDDAHLRFEVCVSVSGVHYPEQSGSELHVIYELLSITHNRRLRVEVAVPERDPQVPSVTATYPMANYHERETYDMFGIIFDGHPSLTRILMPDDWIGHPLRKDYGLGGVPVRFDGAEVPPPDQRRSYLL
ncbi:MAG: NADH-quinone oxidoreductase subunit C [Propionibacteriaceae bacterium]|jgi:NADH-quinone oxidoreductase subunit C|nr:NADH-quinone oxidoreductase subunit C [Propionibacteriaceae bacterium]